MKIVLDIFTYDELIAKGVRLKISFYEEPEEGFSKYFAKNNIYFFENGEHFAMMHLIYCHVIECLECGKVLNDSELIYDGDDDTEYCPNCGKCHCFKVVDLTKC